MLGIDRYVKCLARRKGFEIARFLCDGPRTFNGRVNPFRYDHVQDSDDSSSIH
jgi:hypothetical protein